MIDEFVIYAPLHGFVRLLALGWELPLVAEPMLGHHGAYSVLLSWPADRGSARLAPPPPGDQLIRMPLIR